MDQGFSGENGKGYLWEVVTHMFGSYASEAPMSLMTKDPPTTVSSNSSDIGCSCCLNFDLTSSTAADKAVCVGAAGGAAIAGILVSEDKQAAELGGAGSGNDAEAGWHPAGITLCLSPLAMSLLDFDCCS